MVVVSLRGCQAECSGFQDYLGERLNEQTGLWEERYGKKAKLPSALTFMPRKRETVRRCSRSLTSWPGRLF